MADVYDALTSKRTYEPALSHDVARSMIVDETGAHFDPNIVQAFLKREDDFLGVLHAPGRIQPMSA